MGVAEESMKMMFDDYEIIENEDGILTRIIDEKTNEVLWEGFVKSIDYDCLGKRQ